MAVAISSRSSDRTRRTMFSSAWSNGRPRLTSRMTRPNSVEIGGRDSRTTISIACRNDEPARSALAIRVIVSGSCLLNALSRPFLRRLSQKRGSRKPTKAPIEQHDRVAQARADDRQRQHHQRDADDRAAPDEEELARLELEVGASDVARQVRAEVALLDDLVEVGQRRALGEQIRRWPPARGGRLGLLRLGRRRSARGARRSPDPPDVAMPTAISKIARAAIPATASVIGLHGSVPPSRP